MNPAVRFIVLVALVLGAGFAGLRQYQSRSLEYEHSLDLARIRQDFLERASWVRVMPEQTKYADEVHGLFKWYFGELNDHYNRFAKFKNYDRAMDGFDADLKKRRLKEEEHKQYAERFRMTKALFELMRTNKYEPELTGTDHGLRVDLYKIERLQVGDKSKIRLNVALWGAQRQMKAEALIGGGRKLKMQVQAQFTEVGFKLFDEKGKLYGEMNASGDPELKIDYPERWIEEFPPQIVFGYYDLDPFPSQAAKLDLTVSVLSRSQSGEDIPGSFHWSLPLRGEWKLGEGEKWEGATEETREEEAPSPRAARR